MSPAQPAPLGMAKLRGVTAAVPGVACACATKAGCAVLQPARSRAARAVASGNFIERLLFLENRCWLSDWPRGAPGQAESSPVARCEIDGAKQNGRKKERADQLATTIQLPDQPSPYYSPLGGVKASTLRQGFGEQPQYERLVIETHRHGQRGDLRRIARRQPYQILLGRDQGESLLRRFGEKRVELGFRIEVMIGKAARRCDSRAERREGRKKLFRPADASEGEDVAPFQARRRRRLRYEPRANRLSADGGAPALSGGIRRVNDHRDGDMRPLRAGGRTQRSGRKAEPVAETIGAVDRRQAEILGERGILQAVVEDKDARASGDRCIGGGRSIRRDEAGRDTREQQRLVADLARAVALRIDRNRRAAAPAAIAARQERDVLALRDQQLGDRDRSRRLARAADGEIADADHRRGGAPSRSAHTPCGERAVNGAKRLQGSRGDARRLRRPEARRPHVLLSTRYGAIARIVRSSAPVWLSTA